MTPLGPCARPCRWRRVPGDVCALGRCGGTPGARVCLLRCGSLCGPPPCPHPAGSHPDFSHHPSLLALLSQGLAVVAVEEKNTHGPFTLAFSVETSTPGVPAGLSTGRPSMDAPHGWAGKHIYHLRQPPGRPGSHGALCREPKVAPSDPRLLAPPRAPWAKPGCSSEEARPRLGCHPPPHLTEGLKASSLSSPFSFNRVQQFSELTKLCPAS